MGCAPGLREALVAPCFARDRFVVMGCGQRAAWCYDPLGQSWTLAYDQSGELVGATVSYDTTEQGICGPVNVYRWGRQDLAHWDHDCPDFAECTLLGDQEDLDDWSCP
jgi:YD repeat-containing protein